MLNLTNNKTQSGISLLEVMLSLSIIAIIVVMAARYFFVANGAAGINKLRGQIATVVSALQEYRAQHPDYSGVTSMQVLINGGFIAQANGLNAAADVYTNPWDNPINVVGTKTAAVISTIVPTQIECNAVMASYSARLSPSCTVAAGSGNRGYTFSLTVGNP